MINWEGIIGGVTLLVLMAMLVERGAAFVFAWRAWRQAFGGMNERGLKSIVILGISYVMCDAAKFSILNLAYGADKGIAGTLLTALVVAGGSAKAFELFQQALALKEKKAG